MIRGGRGLSDVTEFAVPGPLLDDTLDVLAAAGRHHREAFVLWGGVRSQSHFMFTSMIVPAQSSHTTPNGLLVTVDGEALFQVNRTMYQRGETLAGQVHSHPTVAFHSDTDDHYPLVTLLGALSIVVPDFATDGRKAIDRWAWYRLAGVQLWEPVDDRTSVRIIG